MLQGDTDNKLVKPLTYHNRTEQVLPPQNSQVQTELNNLMQYSEMNEMRINTGKSKIMLFNTSKKNDFTPEMTINNETLEVVEEFELLGVKISNDLKWHSNTAYITQRGFAKLWLLRRLKAFGANTSELLDMYCKQVRSILEYAAVVWHCAIKMLFTRADQLTP